MRGVKVLLKYILGILLKGREIVNHSTEINIVCHLSWTFFCQNAAEEIITSLAEKRKQTNNLIQGGAGAHSRFLKKAQSIAKLWWLGSDLHPLGNKLGISFAPVLLVFYQCTHT